jgi:hypothetical protein
MYDNLIPVVPVDYKEHAPEKPFCWNDSCPCREDQKNIAQVAKWVTDGLMTPEQATDFVRGRGI